MPNISDYTLLNVADPSQQVTVAANGLSVNVGNQTAGQTIYTLAVVNQAFAANNAKLGNQLNQIQAKNNQEQSAAALIAGLSTVDTTSGLASTASIYTALHTSMASLNLSDDQIATVFQNATGKALGNNDSYTQWTDVNFATAISNAKTYSQNLLSDGTVLQEQLDNYTNLQTTFTEAMTALIKGLSDSGATITRGYN